MDGRFIKPVKGNRNLQKGSHAKIDHFFIHLDEISKECQLQRIYR